MELYIPQSLTGTGCLILGCHKSRWPTAKSAPGGHFHCSWYHAIFEERLLQWVKCWLFHSSKKEVKPPTPLLYLYPKVLNSCEHNRLLPGQYTHLKLLQGTTTTDLHRNLCSVCLMLDWKPSSSWSLIYFVCIYTHTHTHIVGFVANWNICITTINRVFNLLLFHAQAETCSTVFYHCFAPLSLSPWLTSAAEKANR